MNALRAAAALATGMLFGAGLAISQMTDPRKVIGFLDVTGAWDPSLAFVMLGAVTVAFIGFHLVRRRPAPLLDDRFHLPEHRAPDFRLIAGAALFGVGWGLTGYCPGPALANFAFNWREALVFVPAMLAGAVTAGRLRR